MSVFPVILDVAIGMAFIFLTLSAIASAINELVARVVNSRGIYLAQGIIFLLSDARDSQAWRFLFPFLSRFGRQAKLEIDSAPGLIGYVLNHSLLRRLGTDYPKFPAYVPAGSFSSALIEGLLEANPVARYEFMVNQVNKLVTMQASIPLDEAIATLNNTWHTALENPSIQAARAAMQEGRLQMQTLAPLLDAEVARRLAGVESVQDAAARAALSAVQQAMGDVRLAMTTVKDDKVRAGIQQFFDALDVNEIKNAIQSAPDQFVGPSVKKTLLTLVGGVQADIQKAQDVQAQLQGWFNDGMKRVSVLYKRYAQAVLIAIGVGICLFFNADALRIVNDLWIDPTVRGALVAAAQNVNSAGFVQPTPAPNATPAPTSSNPTPTPATFAQQFGSTQTNITTLVGQLNGVPLGWDCQEYNKIFRSGAVTPTPTAPPAAGAPAAPAPTATPAPGFIAELTSACTQENGQQLMGGRVSGPVLLQKLAGILLMSAGVGFGAPFWFDLLGKLISLRPDKPS